MWQYGYGPRITTVESIVSKYSNLVAANTRHAALLWHVVFHAFYMLATSDLFLFGQLKHDCRRPVDVDQRPVQFLLER